MIKPIKTSALNLVPVRKGANSSEAIQEMIDLAQYLDTLNYERLWIAEHHNTPSLASSATKQLIQYTLQHTKKIRVGSGGIMLPNHSPLIVAEEFGTMHDMFGDRIDIGLGRAPGTDMKTAYAIRRNNLDGEFNFKEDIISLQNYFKDHHEGVYSYPGRGKDIPIYILGSSTDSAHLAAHLGLPYVFAAHFAPDQMEVAFKIYEKEFQPSKQLKEPYKIACLNVIMADTNEEAEYLSTTFSQFVLNIIKHTKNKLQPPVNNMDDLWTPYERMIVESRFPMSMLGDIKTVQKKVVDFQNIFNVDEIMAVTYIYDHEKQKYSYKLFEKALESLK